jgi:DNA-binding beta-propeller fold protein YncE/tRNA A-37 threonylcarbamoyl transferase component Bud32
MVSEDVPGGSAGDLTGFGPGSRIAGYVLQEQVGRGGMAVVFRALDVRLDRQVALKILDPSLAADETFRQRFIRESRTAAAVEDPHIIPVYEAGEAGGVLFIAMRYVRGGDVRSLLARDGPLPPGRVAEIITQVSSALDAAHERGLVHRDVKPANMLLDVSSRGDRPDHVYLSDFGLTKGAVAATGLTATGQFLGTLDYIAPEQIEGKIIDGRADEYALACAAFELLAGEPPFRRNEAMAVMYAQLSQPPPAVTSLRPGLPGAVDAVLQRALAKVPADRYPDCRDFAGALRAALGLRRDDSGEGMITPAGGPPTQLVWPEAGRGTVAGSGPAAAVPGGSAAGARDDRAASAPGPPTRIVPAVPAAARTDVYPPADDAAVAARRRPAWRSPAMLAAALIVVLALGGGGAYFALSGPTKAAKPGGSDKAVTKPVTFLTAPGCSTAAAAGKTLDVATSEIQLDYASPFGVQVSSDGKYVFATTPKVLSVLTMTASHTAAAQFHYVVAAAGESAKGLVLTSDGKDVAIAVGNEVSIQNAAAAEQGASSAHVTSLIAPGVQPKTNADQVAVSPGGQFAFVTLQNSGTLAVFSLRNALGGEADPRVFVGSVSLGFQPTGLTESPDGKYLYVTSMAAAASSSPAEGLLSVLSMAKLETHPASALVGQAQAGCGPARVITSADGSTVWVTARLSNALLGFSAARLLTDPKQALLADVQVGQAPTGIVLADGGARMIVADTNLSKVSGADSLAVVSVASALAGKPALIGYIASGKEPRDLALAPGGQYLYVTDSGTSQLQVVNLGTLP